MNPVWLRNPKFLQNIFPEVERHCKVVPSPMLLHVVWRDQQRQPPCQSYMSTPNLIWEQTICQRSIFQPKPAYPCSSNWRHCHDEADYRGYSSTTFQRMGRSSSPVTPVGFRFSVSVANKCVSISQWILRPHIVRDWWPIILRQERQSRLALFLAIPATPAFVTPPQPPYQVFPVSIPLSSDLKESEKCTYCHCLLKPR